MNMSTRTIALTITALLFTAAAGVFSDVRHYHVVYDSLGFVWENPYLRELTLTNLGWALSQRFMEVWQPLTWLSHMLDFQLFGEWAGGHHLVSVLLHTANACALYLLLRCIPGLPGPTFAREIGSATAALIFAVHPLHVESAVMLFERRDLLYTGLLALAVGAYYRHRYQLQKPGSLTAMPVCLTLYLLALLAKPLAICLPLLLVLLDLHLDREQRCDWRTIRYQIQDKGFAIAMALPVIAVTLMSQATAMVPFDIYPLPYRLLNVLHNIWFFVSSFFLPTGLTAYYPFTALRDMTAPGFWAPGAALLLLTLTVSSICWHRGWRGPLLLLLALVGTWAPVMGVLHAGSAARTDHYFYLPLTFLCIACGWLVARGLSAGRLPRTMTLACSGFFILVLLVMAKFQVSTWASPFSLWHYNLTLYPQAELPRRNLALSFIMIGEYDLAEAEIAHLRAPVQDELRALIVASRTPAVKRQP